MLLDQAGLDKRAVSRGFSGCYETYTSEAVVQQQIALKLACMVQQQLAIMPHRAVEVGCGSGFMTDRLLRLFPQTEWFLNDIAPSSAEYAKAAAKREGVVRANFVLGDAEKWELPPGIDLFASSSAIQWFVDLELFVARLAGAMSSGGIVAISSFGPKNLKEVKHLTGNGLSYLGFDELKRLFSRHFEVVDSSELLTSLYFDKPIDVLKHIKQTGVNGAFRQCWTKGRLEKFCADYAAFATKDGFPLTYHPLYVIARKR